MLTALPNQVQSTERCETELISYYERLNEAHTVNGSSTAEIGFKGEAAGRSSTVEAISRDMEPPHPGQSPAVMVTNDPEKPSKETSEASVHKDMEPPSAPAATGLKDTSSSPELLVPEATAAKTVQPVSMPTAREKQSASDKDADSKQVDPQTEAVQKGTSFFQPYWSAKFFITAIGAILIIWSFAWMYLGAFWNPMTRLSNLHVAVLNCDTVPPTANLNGSFAPLLPLLAPQPLATSLLASSVWNKSSSTRAALWWEEARCGNMLGGGCGPQEAECVAALSESVRQGGPWALLYFSSHFTSDYLSWFAGSGISPPQKPPTATYVIARGRDMSTYTYLNSMVQFSILPGLSRSLTLKLAATGAGGPVLQRLAPSFLATGIAVQQVDLAPVKNFGQHFASYIFCVLLWLGSSFVVGGSYQFKLPSEMQVLDPRRPPESRTVRMRHLAWALFVKGVIAALFMFIEMILLCIVLWALGDGNEQWHKNAGHAIAFGWYMSWSFISINALLLHVLGFERFSSITALLLILQLTSASGIMSIELCNRFFYIGNGLPFFYGVRGFRAIFFGTLTDKMYQNWLVLTAYNLVMGPLVLLLVVRRVWSAAGGGAGPSAAQPGGATTVGQAVLPVGFA